MMRNYLNYIMYLLSKFFIVGNKYSNVPSKIFYMRAIGLIIIRKDFDEVNQLLKCIFIVSMNEEKGLDMNKELTPCENVENYLK